MECYNPNVHNFTKTFKKQVNLSYVNGKRPQPVE